MRQAVIITASLWALGGCQTAVAASPTTTPDTEVVEIDVTATASQLGRLDNSHHLYVGVFDNRPRTAPVRILAARTEDLSPATNSYKVTLRVPVRHIRPDRNYVVRAEIRDRIGNPRFITASPAPVRFEGQPLAVNVAMVDVR